jgi:two-component system, OmpR family, sensor histidine kinase BaeS
MTRSLRVRLMLATALGSLVVAAVIVGAVQWISSEQVMKLLMEGVASEEEARLMVEEYIGRVVVIAAAAGLVLGGLIAWWLVWRVLRPLEDLREATRLVAAGSFDTRVPEPPDEELRQLARSFNQMTATLQRTEELRSALIEDVSHELRTPLTSLRGYTEALAEGVVEPTAKTLGDVHEEIERLVRLVDELDRLARIDDPASAQARAEVDLGDVVRRALAIVAPELASRSVTVRFDTSAAVPPLVADPDAIGQVVANLVSNAARHTTDGGEVTAVLEADAGTVRCTIGNTGPAIPPDELPLIWERFHRVDPSRSRATGGAGVGLAIVRQIVQSHGGDVGARSGDGRTEVWFSLPASG